MVPIQNTFFAYALVMGLPLISLFSAIDLIFYQCRQFCILSCTFSCHTVHFNLNNYFGLHVYLSFHVQLGGCAGGWCVCVRACTLAPCILAPSILAPCIWAPSVLALSISAPSTLAPSILAIELLAPSILALILLVLSISALNLSWQI